MFSTCCIAHHAAGASVCPVCQAQLLEERAELAAARTWTATATDLKPATRALMQAGAISPCEVGLPSRPAAMAAALRRNRNRRIISKLLGIYLPEREATSLLRRIHDFKWIEAEKAGVDFWQSIAPREPFVAAARVWAEQYLPQFIQHEGCTVIDITNEDPLAA